MADLTPRDLLEVAAEVFPSKGLFGAPKLILHKGKLSLMVDGKYRDMTHPDAESATNLVVSCDDQREWLGLSRDEFKRAMEHAKSSAADQSRRLLERKVYATRHRKNGP